MSLCLFANGTTDGRALARRKSTPPRPACRELADARSILERERREIGIGIVVILALAALEPADDCVCERRHADLDHDLEEPVERDDSDERLAGPDTRER